jgi:hypothetical protein
MLRVITSTSAAVRLDAAVRFLEEVFRLRQKSWSWGARAAQDDFVRRRSPAPRRRLD